MMRVSENDLPLRDGANERTYYKPERNRGKEERNYETNEN